MNGAYTIREAGFALVTAMIFLVLLTLVALVALRGSGLEAISSGNNALRLEALESSETARMSVGDVIDAHVYNRGWPPTVSGGTVPQALFGTIPTGLTITNSANWYGTNTEDSGNGFNPAQLDQDATYSISIGNGGSAATVSAKLSVYKLRVGLATGTGTAMVQGYEGTGRAAASGGGNLFFYLKSSGTDLGGSGSTSNYDTSADFRYVIRN